MKKFKILTLFLLTIPLFLLCGFTTNASKEVEPTSSNESWKLILENLDIEAVRNMKSDVQRKHGMTSSFILF